jgi:hypothetical protein
VAFTHELKAAFPSFGPDWDRAVEMGVDVSLLLENLTLSPTQRIAQLEDLLREVDAFKRAVKRRDPVP